MVFHAAQRRHALDAEHEGLVFGRLDLRDRQVLHVGPARACATRTPRTLVVDWRAPAAAAFYQATPAEPLGVVRRRTIQSPRRAGHRHRGRPARPGRPPRRACRSSATARCWPPCPRPPAGACATSSRPSSASRTRRSAPPAPGSRSSRAAPAPARPLSPCTGPPTCSTPTAAGTRAAASWWSARRRSSWSTSARCCRRWARTPRPCTRWARSFPGMSATRTDPPEVAAVKGSLRMRRVLERAARDAVPGGPAELRLLYRGTLLRLDRRRAGPDPGPRAAPRGPPQRGAPGRLRRGVRRALGAGP